MSLLKYGTIRLPPNYKAKLEAHRFELERVNQSAQLAIVRSDEYDALSAEQLALNSLMYTTAENLNEVHELGLHLPLRPDTRVTFEEKQQDTRVAAYSLLAVSHVLSVSLTEYVKSANDARDNLPAQSYDRYNPGETRVHPVDITGHVGALTDMFGTVSAQDEQYDANTASLSTTILPSVQAIVATRPVRNGERRMIPAPTTTIR